MLTISQLLKLSQVLGHDAVWWDLIWIWRPFREKGCCYCCSFFLVSVFKIQCYVSQGHETYACIQYKKRNLEDTENTFTTPHARTHAPTDPPTRKANCYIYDLITNTMVFPITIIYRCYHWMWLVSVLYLTVLLCIKDLNNKYNTESLNIRNTMAQGSNAVKGRIFGY